MTAVSLLCLALALVPPLSWLTIQAFPALNGATDPIHAVKMGYHAFWCVVLSGGALLAAASVERPRGHDRVNKS